MTFIQRRSEKHGNSHDQQTEILLKMGFTTYIFKSISSTFQIFYELFSTPTVGNWFQRSDKNFKEKTNNFRLDF